MKFCTNCGQKLQEGFRFCTNCGTPIRPISQVEPKPVQPQVQSAREPELYETVAAPLMPELNIPKAEEVRPYWAEPKQEEPKQEEPDMSAYETMAYVPEQPLYTEPEHVTEEAVEAAAEAVFESPELVEQEHELTFGDPALEVPAYDQETAQEPEYVVTDVPEAVPAEAPVFDNSEAEVSEAVEEEAAPQLTFESPDYTEAEEPEEEVSPVMPAAMPEVPNWTNQAETYQQGTYQQGGYQQNSYQQNSYQQNGYQQNGYQQNGYQQNGYQQNGYQQSSGLPPVSATPPGGYQRLDEHRGILKLILLNFITCGIYSFFWIHKLAQDINTACAGDGKESIGGLGDYILYSILTCGVYSTCWQYELANRIKVNAPRYGTNVQDNGLSLLLWQTCGSMLCGLGPIIAQYKLCKNANILCSAYNRTYGL